jgi:predicted permease
LSNLASLFANNLIPVLLIAGVGYLLARGLHLEAHTLSQVCFYVFNPCLIFSLISTDHLESNAILGVIAVTTLSTLGVGLIVWLIGRLLRLPRRMLAAVLLASMFINSGNFGLPVIRFAFGEQAFSYGSLFYVTSAVLIYSVGVVIASMGKASFGRALLNLARVPALYSLALGLFFLVTGWRLPTSLERSINTLAGAAIPAMLILLGLQFSKLNLNGQALPLALANFARLVISPALVFGLSALFGLHGAAFQASVLQAAMPSAVLNTVLATEFDVEPAFVTTAVFTSTLLSPLTLTPLMAFLGG